MTASARLFYLVLPALLLAGMEAAAEPPKGTFSQKRCVACHAKTTPQIVADWRDSRHAGSADCVRCHGSRHEGSAERARRDDACRGCHGGEEGAVVHSYATSKHGILVRLEHSTWDWSQPLSAGNYRAPTCAYCHLYAGAHDIGSSVTPWEPLRETDAARHASAREAMAQVCRDCHAPRYVATLFASNARMFEIGRMKLREAHVLVQAAREEGASAQLRDMEALYRVMESSHLRNLRLGSAHQSPDYQWWLGHPALDGDLLRIKGLQSDLQRRVVPVPPGNPGRGETGARNRP